MGNSFWNRDRKIAPDNRSKRNTLKTAIKTDPAPIGPTAKALQELEKRGIAPPDQIAMQDYRLTRIRKQLRKADIGAILLYDPINIRYATGSSNMQVWTSHNLARAALVTVHGHVILWDFAHCEHLTAHLNHIDEIRTGAGHFYFTAGDKEHAQAARFVAEVKSILKDKGLGAKLAIDRMEVHGVQAFEKAGVKLTAGHVLMEHARLIKSPDEILAMRASVAACEIAVRKMEDALKPGMAEVELWSILHAENIARGGEWVETRLLCSGPRTNPWMYEAGPRIIEDRDLLAFDTDLIGLYGMCCDMSRTWLAGYGKPTLDQKEAYKVAHKHILENTEMLAPGVSFHDLTHGGHTLPAEYDAQKYCVKMHGIGLCDEFPSIYYPDSYMPGAFDYELKPGMTLCVESYAGKVGGRDGVKLENQVLITETGYENLVTYPYDERLLS